MPMVGTEGHPVEHARGGTTSKSEGPIGSWELVLPDQVGASMKRNRSVETVLLLRDPHCEGAHPSNHVQNRLHKALVVWNCGGKISAAHPNTSAESAAAVASTLAAARSSARAVASMR